MLFHSATVFAAATVANESKIKAAYIYQLTHFVTWPEISGSTKTTFTICVLGKDSISKELAPLNQRKNGALTFKVSRPKTIQDSSNCNILYVAKTEKRRLKSILRNSSNKPILTVSSIPGFITKGGIIGFVILDNKVRLEINRATACHADIELSAKLLEVADIVRNGEAKECKP